MSKAIAVISQNRAGLIADICNVLAARHINIETLDANEAQELAVVSLTVNRYDEALQALREAGIEATSEDAVTIRLPDEPGALAKIAKRFKEAGIDLRTVRIIRRQSGYALVALAGEHNEQVADLVNEFVVRE